MYLPFGAYQASGAPPSSSSTSWSHSMKSGEPQAYWLRHAMVLYELGRDKDALDYARRLSTK